MCLIYYKYIQLFELSNFFSDKFIWRQIWTVLKRCIFCAVSIVRNWSGYWSHKLYMHERIKYNLLTWLAIAAKVNKNLAWIHILPAFDLTRSHKNWPEVKLSLLILQYKSVERRHNLIQKYLPNGFSNDWCFLDLIEKPFILLY